MVSMPVKFMPPVKVPDDLGIDTIPCDPLKIADVLLDSGLTLV